MANQLFKEKVPLTLFTDFLKNAITPINDENNKNLFIYKVNKTIFKKLLYLNVYEDFLQKINKFYYLSKRHYVEKTQTYNSFLTICRQICKSHNIIYKSNILYDKSKYEIIYNLYIESND